MLRLARLTYGDRPLDGGRASSEQPYGKADAKTLLARGIRAADGSRRGLRDLTVILAGKTAARFASTLTPRRGIYLLTCHEGKGKEFDFVVLSYVADDNFEDNEESRQLLYVSLSRARRWILVRVASGKVPPICRRLGLV